MKNETVKALLTILLLLTGLSADSQTVKNASHYFFYKSTNAFYTDSLSVNETVYLTNYNDSVKSYYRIEFNNHLNHILEILVYNSDTIGVLTTFFYEVNEVKLRRVERKRIGAKKVKKFNYA